MRRQSTRSAALVLTVVLVLVTSACSSRPITVRQVPYRAAYDHRMENALSVGAPSNATRIVLRRYDLSRRFTDAPTEAIAELHATVTDGRASAHELFALSELSFLYAQAVKPRAQERSETGTYQFRSARMAEDRRQAAAFSEARANFLASAVYAYAFLLPEERDDSVSVIDPRIRTACDLYSRALVEAFSSRDGSLELQSGAHSVPFGIVQVSFDPQEIVWGERKLVQFRSLANLEVDGLTNQYRRAGFGAPLAAHTAPLDPNAPVLDLVSPNAWVPASLILRLERPLAQLQESRLNSRLELYTAVDEQTIMIDGRTVPLEFEPSLALAATLEQSRFWEYELARFFGRAVGIAERSSLASDEPYRPGRIPVVLVHGTDSTAASWANTVNDLRSDRRIQERYQFWFFGYESGNPILYSSMLLRRALRDTVERLDPEGKDDCLQRMVVIGHSQGGLLTKLTAVDSGTRFWDAVYTKPFDEVELRPKTRALLEEGVFLKPLPFVRRVIFVATPHRGSFLAGAQFVQRLAARLIRIPSDLAGISTEAVGLEQFRRPGTNLNRLSTSIDNMSPSHQFIRTSAKIPVVREVTAHSIIAVREGQSPIEEGNDGVVKYSSAHVDWAESELVVRSGHSCQANPHTVEELRRILFLHAEQQSCWEGI